MRVNYEEIVTEILDASRKFNLDQLDDFVSRIQKSNRIACIGAGRVGLAMMSFSMRLTHLGFTSYFVGETNLPKLDKNDLLIIGSGSGGTRSIVAIAEAAINSNLQIALITATPKSRIALMSNSVLSMHGESILEFSKDSIQPMTTLFEQSLQILLDSIVLHLMSITGQTTDNMRSRHNILE
jgi:6-phospho-3-hexuloisomerase